MPQNVHNRKNKDDFLGTMFSENFLCAVNLFHESFHMNVVGRLDSTRITHLTLFPLLVRDNLESQNHVSN